MIVIAAFAVVSAPDSYYWCWGCGLRFTIPPQGDKIICPKCNLHVTVANARLWHDGVAWCPTCQLFYGIIQVVGREPECPRCHHLPNGEQPTRVQNQSPNASPAEEVN